MTELERCDEEIHQVEQLLRRGHQDVEGLVLALTDWGMERRLIERDLEIAGRLANEESGDRPRRA